MSATLIDSERENVVLVNRISVLLTILPFIYVGANVFNLGWSRITVPILSQPVFFLLPVLFNYLKLPNVARIWLSWSMPFQAIIFSIYNKSHGMDHQTAHYTGILFSILASSVIPFLVFRLKESQLISIAILPSIIALFGFDAIHNFFGAGYYQSGLNETGYSITPMRVFIAFILITGSSTFLKRKVEKKEEQNQKLVTGLSEKNDEIQAQLEEIISQNEQISFQNNQLELQKKTIEEQNNFLSKAKEELELRVQEKVRDVIRANLDLEKQNSQLEQFAYMTAHNLRSPVARIMGLSQLVGQSQTDISEILEKIKKSCIDLDEVMHDLITIVQVGKEGNRKKEPVRILPIIESVLGKLTDKIKDSRTEIITHVDPELKITGDQVLAHSVFMNVIGNSLKFKNQNPIISIRADRKDSNYLALEVSDNGVGFDSERYADKMFKPFSKINSTHEGKGLGLYLVKIQMESMGGRVALKSRPHEGTSVSLLFRHN